MKIKTNTVMMINVIMIRILMAMISMSIEGHNFDDVDLCILLRGPGIYFHLDLLHPGLFLLLRILNSMMFLSWDFSTHPGGFLDLAAKYINYFLVLKIYILFRYRDSH